MTVYVEKIDYKGNPYAKARMMATSGREFWEMLDKLKLPRDEALSATGLPGDFYYRLSASEVARAIALGGREIPTEEMKIRLETQRSIQRYVHREHFRVMKCACCGQPITVPLYDRTLRLCAWCADDEVVGCSVQDTELEGADVKCKVAVGVDDVDENDEVDIVDGVDEVDGRGGGW